MKHRRNLWIGGAALALVPCVPFAPAAAQAVVQPLADPDAAHLSEVLRALAREPGSLTLLAEAGEASLAVDDVAAAEGFFKRARAIDPANAQVKAGMASVLVRQEQPVEALRLYAEAESAGGQMVSFLGDRGLAYDLVGDNRRAQQDYARALTAKGDDAITLRLALSQAISGNEKAAEVTLLPLLQRSDLAAFRTRAFALAIAGKSDESVSIAETMLPGRISSRLAPYLRFMPRLTRAQQAAAANLGHFPRADDIGKDGAEIAALSAAAIPVATPTAQLAAAKGTGAQLASADQARSTGRGLLRGRSSSRSQPAPASAPTVAATSPTTIVAAARPVAVAPAVVAAATPVRVAVPVQVPVSAPASIPAPEQAVAHAPASLPGDETHVAVATASQPVAATIVATPVAPSTAAPAAPVVQAVVAPSAPTSAPTSSAPVAPTARPPAPRDLALAFADFTTAAPAQVAEGAVNMATFQPRREGAPAKLDPAAAAAAAASGGKPAAGAKPAAKPVPKPAPKPVIPSRHWVQIATGRNTGALGYDWRRLKHDANGLLDKYQPQYVDWGQTNRMVVGPFGSVAEAERFVGKLKDKKMDAFRFTSDEGEEVKPLK